MLRTVGLLGLISLLGGCDGSPLGPDTVVRLSISEVNMLVGDTVRLGAFADEVQIPDTVPRWTSLDASIASLDARGLLTGHAPGATDVVVTIGDRSLVVPVVVTVRWTAILAGDAWVCARDHQDARWCWGDNTYGTFGSGPGERFSALTRVPVLDDFAPVATGRRAACALDGQTAHCWGDDPFGQLGRADTSSMPLPVEAAPPMSALAMGDRFGCGVTPAGAPWCWGNLAVIDSVPGCSSFSCPLARPIASPAALQRLAAGVNHVCGLDQTGAAWCFGDSPDSTLGTGGPRADTARKVQGAPSGATAIVAGSSFTCVLAPDGRAFCWGNGSTGGLGRPGAGRDPVPTPVEGTATFADLASHPLTNHACGLTTDGEAWCWGGNSAGQVGNGDTLSTPLHVFAPARVATDVRFTRLAVGEQFTCGLTADGVVWCWGRNQSGVLGSETPHNTSTPVRVR